MNASVGSLLLKISQHFNIGMMCLSSFHTCDEIKKRDKQSKFYYSTQNRSSTTA